MSSTTDIEKKSLEAHVELCAERYENLENKLSNLDSRLNKLDGRMDTLEGHIVDIKSSIQGVGNDSNKTIITIGTSIFGILLTAILGLVIHFATK